MNKKNFVSGAIWKILEALSSRGISLVISIILARLLLPKDYGIVALTAVFINLSIILVQSGITTSLVRKEKISVEDYNNGFLLGICIAIICYVIIFFTSPFIASFYKEPLLIPVLRVQMLSLFIVAFGNINNVIITREFRFKELCLAGIVGNSISGLIGIVLAYLGFGVWALVFSSLLRDLLSTLVVFVRIRWLPRFKFDIKALKTLLHFSIFVFLSSFMDFMGNNFSSTVLGKKYSLDELGLYAKGNQIPEMICLYTFGAISSVLLPTLSNYQNDKSQLKHICKRMVELSSYLIFPMMIGLCLIVTKLIPFLFTDKWLSSIPVFFFACIYFGVNVFRTINIQLLYAVGQSKRCLVIEIIRSILLITGTIICVFVLKTNVYGVACVAAIVSIINVIITQFFAKQLLGYGFQEWFFDMMPALKLCLCMALTVFLIGFLPLQRYLLMFIQILLGIISYIGFSKLFSNKSYIELRTLLLEKIRNIKKG